MDPVKEETVREHIRNRLSELKFRPAARDSMTFATAQLLGERATSEMELPKPSVRARPQPETRD